VSKISTAAAFAAIMAAGMPAAYAQTQTPTAPAETHATANPPAIKSETSPPIKSETNPPAIKSERSTAWQIQPDQVRASQMIGSTVYDVHNRDIGSIKDLVLDRDGQVAEVVVDVGSFLGIGGKHVAVKMSDLNSDNNRLTLDMTKQQLKQLAEYHLTDRNTGAGTTSSPVTGGRLGR
jgi:sporulation protein YlmC with PRC-barrel domain